MWIEYLDGPDEYLPLIRLFNFTTQEIVELRQAVDQLAGGGITEFDLVQLPTCKMIAGVRFVFRLAERDEGIKEVSPMCFELRYTQDGWCDVSGGLEQFERDSNGWQWLLDVPTDVNLLLSRDGAW